VSESFEPTVAVFLCNWSVYADVDGLVSRLSAVANVLPIRVMCSGQVSPEMILRAFRAGVDGVLVLGCHDGDCHYISSGHRVAKRVPLVRDLVDYVSIDPERLRLDRGSGETTRALEVVQQFVEKLRALGPIGDDGETKTV
jgi:F420-non-reducing hydrogenase iron-sulfur subunit